jgi:hypothetical protein
MGMPWRSQMRMIRWVRAGGAPGRRLGEVRSWERPGSAGEEPQQPAVRIGDYLHVHLVPAVFVGVVGPFVADPVACGERAVQEDEVRILLAQDLQQARCTVGEEVDDRAGAGVGGGLADPEPGSDLRQGGVLAQGHSATIARWHGRSLQRRSPSRVTMSMATRSTSGSAICSEVRSTPDSTITEVSDSMISITRH